MQQNLERSWEEIRFARSDKSFSLPGPRRFMGMTDKTIFVVPDVLLQKCKNKAAAQKVYQSITEQHSDEDSEPLQLLQPPGLLLLGQRAHISHLSQVVLLLKGRRNARPLPNAALRAALTHPSRTGEYFPNCAERQRARRAGQKPTPQPRKGSSSKKPPHTTVGLDLWKSGIVWNPRSTRAAQRCVGQHPEHHRVSHLCNEGTDSLLPFQVWNKAAIQNLVKSVENPDRKRCLSLKKGFPHVSDALGIAGSKTRQALRLDRNVKC